MPEFINRCLDDGPRVLGAGHVCRRDEGTSPEFFHKRASLLQAVGTPGGGNQIGASLG
jgi:hypothetical protein